MKQKGDAGYLDGVQAAQPLSSEDVKNLFSKVSTLEKALLSLTLHTGLWPSHIIRLKSSDVDLIQGWVNTPDGRRPLPDVTRQFIYSWLLEEDSLQFSFSDQWETRDDLKEALEAMGSKVNVKLTIDRIYETLARALFEASEEGQAMQSVLGEEVNLVRVPLNALFPFSLADFSGNETNSLGERGRRVLNRAAGRLQ